MNGEIALESVRRVGQVAVMQLHPFTVGMRVFVNVIKTRGV